MAQALISPTRHLGKGRYPHLAISPYPEHYITPANMSDGQPMTLRPIKPEDEPMWLEMLNSCSEESIRMRFFSLISDFTHEMAVRYCVCDYDRELALVAEVEQNGQRKLAGVCRLISDPDHYTAEFAVIITDAWQGRGIGVALTDACLRIAKDWGIRQVVAVTLRENDRMIAIFKARKFKVTMDADHETITAIKKL